MTNYSTDEFNNIAVFGTGSDTGKSVIAAAFCRIFRNMGIRVAPFKAQNMSNNSFVTVEGGEMGRAQVVQAEAAGLEPHTDMNPVLLKPSSDTGSRRLFCTENRPVTAPQKDTGVILSIYLEKPPGAFPV